MEKERNTRVTIQGDQFLINNELTYKGRYWKGKRIEGLLLNSRMVQGIFDDHNPNTVDLWAYPDTGKWDAERNTKEYINNMSSWKEAGLLCLILSLQGGMPNRYTPDKLDYNDQPWVNSAFRSDGTLDEVYMHRLERILDHADELGFVVMLSYFYFGQEDVFNSEEAVKQAAFNATEWVLEKGYTNILIEVANECNIVFNQPILRHTRIHELLELVKRTSAVARTNDPLLVGASFTGSKVPTNNVITASDFVLIHGNGIKDMQRIPEQIKQTREQESYTGQPILYNEDDHFEFDKEKNHFALAVENGVSWGYHDPGLNNYMDGYQSPPINWSINTERKKAFFNKVREITGLYHDG